MAHLKALKKPKKVVILSLEERIAEFTAGADIPDSDDIPGGVMHMKMDLFESAYSAWKEQLIGEHIKRWMKENNKLSFP